MKKDLNNIEEIFKNAFDGFESNVDPSVWSNVQSNISAGNGVSSNTSSLAASTSKAVLTKIVAGVVIATGLATSVYYLSDTNKEVETPISTVVTQNNQVSNQETLIPELEETKTVTIENNTNDVSTQITAEKTSGSVEKQSKVDNGNTKSDKQQAVKTENKTQSNVVAAPQNNNNTVTVANTGNAVNNVADKKATEQLDLIVKIKASQTKGKAPLDVEFNVDGNAVAYSWDFGDGSNISGQENSFHTFTAPGKYIVKLTAIDKNANAKTVLQVITVEQNIKSSISTIPTVFSPNADGINDVIKIDGENIKSFTAIVRDSKGNVVFEWKTLEGFWDGRDLNNQILPKGTYYIVVVAIGIDGENHTKKQTIQLF